MSYLAFIVIIDFILSFPSPEIPGLFHQCSIQLSALTSSVTLAFFTSVASNYQPSHPLLPWPFLPVYHPIISPHLHPLLPWPFSPVYHPIISPHLHPLLPWPFLNSNPASRHSSASPAHSLVLLSAVLAPCSASEVKVHLTWVEFHNCLSKPITTFIMLNLYQMTDYKVLDPCQIQSPSHLTICLIAVGGDQSARSGTNPHVLQLFSPRQC